MATAYGKSYCCEASRLAIDDIGPCRPVSHPCSRCGMDVCVVHDLGVRAPCPEGKTRTVFVCGPCWMQDGGLYDCRRRQQCGHCAVAYDEDGRRL
jgi:hypothetical protein